MPSHLDAPVDWLVPELHALGLHCTLFHSWQAPLPSHMPLRMQVLVASGPHVGWLAGGALPGGMLVQVPAVPVRLQASQAPAHFLSQHTPSTLQTLLRHIPSNMHGVPAACCTTPARSGITVLRSSVTPAKSDTTPAM